MQTTAHFTHIHEIIVSELQKARSSIYIAVAWFTDRELFYTLCERTKTGIVVELMVTNDAINFREGGLPFEQLEKAGGRVYAIGTGNEAETLMHNKFCVIDKQTVITGSFNWSYKARQNHENITISTEAGRLAKQFIAEFHQLKGRYNPSSSSGKVPVNLNKVLKRLDLIKSLIALDETDEIDSHLEKLSQQAISDDLASIVTLLKCGQFAEAVSQIDQFSKQHATLTLYIDTELSALKIEIRILELQVQALEAEKADIEKLLNDFSIQHTLHLSDLLLKLLEVRLKQTISDDEHAEAEADYNQYNQECRATRQESRFELSRDEQQDLKQKFRKAAQLCHPDVVAEALKSQAEHIFAELKNANDRNDLKRVTEILETLERGNTFVSRSETVTEKIALVHERTRLQLLVGQLQTTVQTLQQSKDYQTVSQITEWNIYFAEKREQLKDQLNVLQVSN